MSGMTIAACQTGCALSAGFIPPDAPDPAMIAVPLGSILSQLTTGGGAKGVNIDMVCSRLVQ